MSGWLSGVRLVTFTTGVAGPNAARVLAQCGAEVIKVESRQGGIDSFRYFAEDGGLDESPRFIESNLNVLSLTLNLKDPTGVRLLRELAAQSDVVLDNFRAEVLPRLGLRPADLQAARPDLIVIKLPGLGCTGPRWHWGTWGSTLMALTGATYLWNHPGQPRPIGAQGVYPDYVTTALAPMVVLAALLHRRRTGQGVSIDLAQAEAMASLLGVSYLDALVNDRDPRPVGNDWPYAAPHNCYPCAGEDRWCVIAVETDAQWRHLCEAMGQAALADDPRFATLAARRANLDALDALVTAWTRERDAHAVMTALQTAGVPCGVVQSGDDLYHDPHLQARGGITSVDHPTLGNMPLASLPIRLPAGALEPARRAAMLGEHNGYILGDLLGYSADQIAAWQAAGVVD